MKLEKPRPHAHLTPASWVFLAMIALANPSLATMEEIVSLLQQAETTARPSVPLRADGELVISVPGASPSRHQIILLQRENGDVYIEVREPAIKVLILDAGARASIIGAGTHEARPFALEERLLESDFTREDLEPFVANRYSSPQVADRSSQQITVTLTPQRSQYSLVVNTFEDERRIIVKTLYYAQTLNNLVKMRRDHDHTLVGGRWRPAKVTMEDFQLRTRSVLDLRWVESPSLPLDLFHPDFLGQPSGLAWPPAPAQAAGS